METSRTTSTNQANDDRPPLRRHTEGHILGGVASGLAEYLDVDLSVVRIGFVALGLLGGIAIPLYVAGWLLIPEDGADSAIADHLLGHARAS
jgi:phage shock protein PspC (stress-responsive transcriptional regulator)